MNDNLQIFESLKHLPLTIQFVWAVSFVFFIFIVMLIIYLKYLRSHLRYNERKEADYQAVYESFLVTYLYAGNNDDVFSSEQQFIIDEFKKDVADPFKRKIIIATLLKLRSEISGEIGETIDQLFIKLGLFRYSLAKLRNKKWDVIATGIRELTQFKIKAVHKMVLNNINHPKKEVRKEMQLYLVHLYAFEGLEFLNVLETPLSEWDQIQLLEILQLNNDTHVSDIKPWLNSSNDSVVIFALKLANVYNHLEAKEELLTLLNHKSEDIRINVISTLGHLHVFEAKAILKNNFNERSDEEQIAFLKMMENVYEVSDKPFLLKHKHHRNPDIRLAINEILKNFNSEEYTLYAADIKKMLTA